MLAGTLKCHRVVAIDVAPAGMRLKSQKAKEGAGSSHQGHGFNPSHSAWQIKDSCGQKKRYTVKRDSKMKKTSKWFTLYLKNICMLKVKVLKIEKKESSWVWW